MLAIFFLLLSAISSVSAAGPLFHIYMAERYFDAFGNYDVAEKKRFILGTLFPDIRYIASISRTETHLKEVSIDEVLTSPTPFVAGMKFHSWVDNLRDEFVIRERIYERLPKELTMRQKPSFLKIIEDELILDRIDRELCSGIFEKVDEEELAQGFSERTIERWHTFLLFFLRTSPKTTITLLSLFEKSKELPKGDELESWLQQLNPTLKSDIARTHTEKLIAFLENKLKER